MKFVRVALASLALVALSITMEYSSFAAATLHFGPFASSSPDGSSCGIPWADDTFEREFVVHPNPDGTFDVHEMFKNGTFITNGATSPGACESTSHHGSHVSPGVTGDFHGFLDGAVTGTIVFDPTACTTLSACASTAGFISAVFGPAAQFCSARPCKFNFEYNAHDQGLAFHHWQDKSDNTGADKFEGDIADSTSGDLTRPTMVDARIVNNEGASTDFAEAGDAFAVTFSETMNGATTGATVSVQDQDGTTATILCSTTAGPNMATCSWNSTVTIMTVTLTGTLTSTDCSAPGLQTPFNIFALTGITDTSGNPPDVLGSSDRLVDH